jgi:2-iminobutanoate/2-iminopropanoate deaminase
MNFNTKVSSSTTESIPIAKVVVHCGIVYISGTVALKPGLLEPIADDFRVQAREVFRLLNELLVESQSSVCDLLMVRVYLANIRRDFSAMNEEFASWVGSSRPARTTVEARLAIEGLLLEVDCVACVRNRDVGG